MFPDPRRRSTRTLSRNGHDLFDEGLIPTGEPEHDIIMAKARRREEQKQRQPYTEDTENTETQTHRHTDFHEGEGDTYIPAAVPSVSSMPSVPSESSVSSVSNTVRSVPSVSLCQTDEAERLIQATQPRPGLKWERCLFNLAQHLCDRLALKDCLPLVKQWYERAKPHLGKVGFGEVVGEFAKAYEKVRVPASQGPLVVAKARAERAQVPAWLVGLCGDDADMIRLALFCYELQLEVKERGRESFALGCRPAGEAIGVSHQKALSLLYALCAVGVLKKTKNGTPGKAVGGEANEYLWIGEPQSSPPLELGDGPYRERR
jgi:hypothetical protein